MQTNGKVKTNNADQAENNKVSKVSAALTSYGNNLRLAWKLIKTIFKVSPWLTSIVILQSFVVGLIPIAKIFITASLIDLIFTFVNTEYSFAAIIAHPTLIYFIIAWVGIEIIPKIFGFITSISNQVLGENCYKYFCTQLMTATNKAENLAVFEGQKIFNEAEAIKSQIANAPNILINTLAQLLSSIFTVGTLSLATFFYAWEISFIVLILGIIEYIIHVKVGRLSWSAIIGHSKDSRAMHYIMDLSFHRESRQEIRLYNLPNFLTSKFINAFHSFRLIMNKVRWRSVSIQLLAIIPSLVLLSWLLFVVIKVCTTEASATGDVVFILSAILALRSSIGGVAAYLGGIVGRLVYFEQYYAYIKALSQPLPDDKNNKEEILTVNNLSLSECSFSFPQNELVLNNISFFAEKGEKIAIVGPNGAGKSTFVKLLLGLYQPTSGDINVNSLSLKKLNRQSFWERCAVCFQDYPKYKFTLGENIGFDTDLSELNDNFLKDFYKENFQMDTQLSKEFDGEEMSEGQWQRLSVLRCLHFAQNRDILVMDEPTAAIDPLFEEEIFKRFEQMSKNKIAIFVTHRLSVIRYATRILVMDKGQIVADGTHDELMEKNSLYNKMYSAQANKFITP
ncbi:ATP-binding cassette domain-containing protein [Pseudocolwellia agarivorans]|uniref:ATP-binding cassette domain-containing protein n=1 Tax=Pseudocolwellia agarivorans TaxID=1911682 RepID=UPI0009864260|nr:ABC transporter ATP-binding protein [Pseudocolwellia agarivorans]